MRFFKLCIILFALSVSTQAMAAANLDKEQAGCVGPIQQWLITWTFTTPHDLWGIFTARAKIRNSEIWFDQFAHANASFCKFVGDGHPISGTYHVWGAISDDPVIETNTKIISGTACSAQP